VFESVADTIRKLRSVFWSRRDPAGQGFVALADAYRESGDLEEADKLLREGLERHPDLSSGHVVLGRVLRDGGDLAGAMESFRRVLELDPENTEALEAVGALEAPQAREEGTELPVEDAPDQPGGEHPEPAEPTVEPSMSDAGEPAEGAGPLPVLEDVSAFELDQVHADDLEPMEPHPGPEASESAPLESATEVPASESEDSAAAGESFSFEPEDEGVPDSGLYTRTMAEVFASQGLFLRAVEVYEMLLRSDPGDEALQDRLAELRSVAGVTPTPSREPQEGSEQDDWEEESEAQARHLAEGPEESDVSTPFAWTDHTDETVEPHLETAGEYFARLLGRDAGSGPTAGEGPAPTDEDPFAHLPLVAVTTLAPETSRSVEGELDFLPIVPISDLAPDRPTESEWT
jgi:tetratricopeptide (TPR) repeat protein